MNKQYTFNFECWRTDRFTWVVLAYATRTGCSALLRADIEGPVRILAPDDKESGKLLLYSVEWESLPPVCRANIRAFAQTHLDSRSPDAVLP